MVTVAPGVTATGSAIAVPAAKAAPTAAAHIDKTLLMIVPFWIFGLFKAPSRPLSGAGIP
jgi:hypothetical protein